MAVWKAIHSRFTWEGIGQVTSYSLSYILGFLRAQEAFSQLNAAAQKGVVSNPQTLINNVLEHLSTPQVDEIESKISDFYSALLNFLQSTASQNQEITARIILFLRGYQNGILLSLAETFKTALRLGYGVGYSHGFRAGYEAGYADGYKAGSMAGLTKFLDDVIKIGTIAKGIFDDVVKIAAIFA